jgi:transposase
MLTRDEFQAIYDQGPDAVYAVIVALQQQVTQLTALVADLQTQVQQLQARLDTDSHNSSKPPSSDGLKKPRTTSQRKPSGRKPGGQKGHPGRHLKFTDTPDTLIDHTPRHCTGCGSNLAGAASTAVEARQVVDLPPLSLGVTEHRAHTCVCPHCGCSNQAAFPEGVRARVQYGPRVQALSVYLSTYHLLPYARIRQVFADLFGAPLSTGTVVSAVQSAQSRLQEVVKDIKNALTSASVAHFDESGCRVAGRLHWWHVASTHTLTLYSFHRSRGKIGMDAAGVLPAFRGRAVHDGWSSYQHYFCTHALCNAHHLRELTAVFEVDGQIWAQKMHTLLTQMYQTVQRAKHEQRQRIHPLLEARLEARYRRLLAEGFAANAPPEPVAGRKGRPKQSKARNLLERLERFEPEVLAFLHDFSVPFDNNQAERDIRMLKLKQKMSGCFRAADGAEAFCTIRSYLSTLSKQGQSLWAALEHVFRGTVLPPDLAVP